MTDLEFPIQVAFAAGEINYLVDHPNFTKRDEELIFDGQHVFHLDPEDDMFTILVQCDVFTGRSQARKNWKGPKEIPIGFNTWMVGKRRLKIFVHRPPEDTEPWIESMSGASNVSGV